MAIESLLSQIPKDLSQALFKYYREIMFAFSRNHFAPAELNGAILCEIVLRILEWKTSPDNKYTPLGKPIKNFEQSTKQFANLSQFNDTIRFHIPKLLDVLFTIRNKRGVGHAAGDVNPNFMDSMFVVNACNWIMAELIRIFHNKKPSEAQKIIAGLISRKIPTVWEVAGKKRILDTTMPYWKKVLFFLYNEYPNPIDFTELFKWTEHSNISVFRSKVIIPLHKKALIDYNRAGEKCYISPTGIESVEDDIKRLYNNCADV